MKKTIEIPEKLDEVKLSQWQLFSPLLKPDDKGVKIDENKLNKFALSIFYGIPHEVYTALKVKDIDMLIINLNKVLQSKYPFERRFTFNGIDYGFIPSLDDISFAELTDMDSYTETSDLHRLMSILFRPITDTYKDTYDIEKYKGSNDDLKDMPLGIAFGALDFFFRLGMHLATGILSYSKQAEALQKMSLDLEKSGVGMHLFTLSQTGIFSGMKK